MGSAFQVCFILVTMLPPILSYGYDFVCSRATFYGSPDCKGNPNGACGYGEYGRTANDANVAGVHLLWRNGSGCGACYQVRCKIPHICSSDGVNVVVTDFGIGHYTDFILSPKAYGNMAEVGAAGVLYAHGIVDIEFRRIPCLFNGYNTVIKVHEKSNPPHYLAIIILYEAGQFDVLEVQVWQEDRKEWRTMRRAFGAVFDIVTPPKGSVSLRLLVWTNEGVTWVEARDAIPSDWQTGASYESSIQIDPK